MNTTGNRFGRIMAGSLSLRWRIIAALLSAALLPLIIAGFGSWIVFGGLLERKTLDQMQITVGAHAEAIERYLRERRHLLQLLADTYTFEEISDPSRTRKLLEHLNRVSDNSFVDLGVIDASGKHVVYIGPYDLKDKNYRNTAWFKEVAANNIYISDVFLGYREIPHCIIAVKSGDADRWWLLRATINSEKFDAIVGGNGSSETGDACIVNAAGVFQTSSGLGSILDTMSANTPMYRPGVTETRFERGDSTFLRVTTWINDDRWMLAVERNLDIVRAPVDRAIADGAKVVLLSVVLMIGTTIIATRHLTRQIDMANREREEMTKALMRSARLASIGELATGLAHEINNPLAVISAEQTNILDILDELPRGNARDEIAESLTRCKNQVNRCAGITRKMLQFGRKGEANPELTNIGPLLDEIVDLYKRRFSVRNIELRLDVPSELPEVLIDSIEFEQVLVNLINNAGDALPDGGRIEINARVEDKTIILEIRDNGTGIPRNDLDKIFEPFYTTKPVGRGTGLGLSICYGIVQSWNGGISVDSAEGEGTSVVLELPIKRSKPILT